jgi:hypothetical protein
MELNEEPENQNLNDKDDDEESEVLTKQQMKAI